MLLILSFGYKGSGECLTQFFCLEKDSCKRIAFLAAAEESSRKRKCRFWKYISIDGLCSRFVHIYQLYSW